jgi:YD repeat-containing protein
LFVNGNLTYDGTHTYAYDCENRLLTVDGGSTASYKYDFAGRQVSKTAKEDNKKLIWRTKNGSCPHHYPPSLSFQELLNEASRDN